jgi:hypothetical protein
MSFKSADLALLFHPNGSLQIQGLSQSLMSWYLIPPQDLLTLLARRMDYLSQLTMFGAWDLLEATQSFESLIKKHLSYQEPVKFNIQILFRGPHRVTLKWLARAIPEVNPTSLTAQGMYAGEQFCWNGWFEHYEIMFDNLDLKDVGLLTVES